MVRSGLDVIVPCQVMLNRAGTLARTPVPNATSPAIGALMIAGANQKLLRETCSTSSNVWVACVRVQGPNCVGPKSLRFRISSGSAQLRLTHVFRRIGCGSRHIDLRRVFCIDGGTNVPRRQPLVEHLDHVTRDPETDASGRGHRVKRDRPVGLHALDVAVAVVVVAAAGVATAEARHVPHDLAAGDMEGVQVLDILRRLHDEVRPDDHRQVAVRLIRCREVREHTLVIC